MPQGKLETKLPADPSPGHCAADLSRKRERETRELAPRNPRPNPLTRCMLAIRRWERIFGSEEPPYVQTGDLYDFRHVG
jgi:hypothetical protein